MAALTRPAPAPASAPVLVRAPIPGEGRAIAALWRELWDAHEGWGGYPGSRDAGVYAQLAQRLDDDARVRAGHPILGRHVHLVADAGGVACGQVEGWLERHGTDATTPCTCEVRSLIVTERARHRGAGRALLDALAAAARSLAMGGACVLAAEVLEHNPAQSFYARLGYAPVSWNARMPASAGAAIPATGCGARVAAAQDALAVARLESALASRRRAAGDLRFDRPRTIDATMVGAIARHLGAGAGAALPSPATLVAVDAAGVVRASASFTVHTLEPPFVPMRRALVGRFAVDPAMPPAAAVFPLVALGCKLARSHGAPHVELTDLPPPGSDLSQAVLAAGACAWSRVVTKPA